MCVIVMVVMVVVMHVMRRGTSTPLQRALRLRRVHDFHCGVTD